MGSRLPREGRGNDRRPTSVVSTGFGMAFVPTSAAGAGGGGQDRGEARGVGEGLRGCQRPTPTLTLPHQRGREQEGPRRLGPPYDRAAASAPLAAADAVVREPVVGHRLLVVDVPPVEDDVPA